MNKYKNKKTVVDGYVFDSMREAARYQELKMLEKAGVIKNLELQPEFMLQTAFYDFSGKRQRKITYRADFQYDENKKTVVEDVKGMKTPVYKLKKKLFLYLYPELEFKEVM